MKFIIKENYDEMSKTAGDLVCRYVSENPNGLLCFPSGTTPVGTMRYLVDCAEKGLVSFSECRFVGLDEWVGLTGEDEGSCRNFLNTEFFQPLNIPDSNICFFNGCAENLLEECSKADRFISDCGRIGLILVGLGMNGHIALNEPGISFDLYSHIVQLDNVTVKTAGKYFSKPIELKEGITLGLKHVIEAETAILIVNGKHKSEILKDIIESNVTNRLPATILKLHKNSFIIADNEAAVLIGKTF